MIENLCVKFKAYLSFLGVVMKKVLIRTNIFIKKDKESTICVMTQTRLSIISPIFFFLGVKMKKVMKIDFITMVARQIDPPVHPFTHITPITVLAWDTTTIKGRPLPKPILGL